MHYASADPRYLILFRRCLSHSRQSNRVINVVARSPPYLLYCMRQSVSVCIEASACGPRSRYLRACMRLLSKLPARSSAVPFGPSAKGSSLLFSDNSSLLSPYLWLARSPYIRASIDLGRTRPFCWAGFRVFTREPVCFLLPVARPQSVAAERSPCPIWEPRRPTLPLSRGLRGASLAVVLKGPRQRSLNEGEIPRVDPLKRYTQDPKGSMFFVRLPR